VTDNLNSLFGKTSKYFEGKILKAYTSRLEDLIARSVSSAQIQRTTLTSLNIYQTMNSTLKTILFRCSIILLIFTVALFPPLYTLAAEAASQIINKDFNSPTVSSDVLKGPKDPKEVEIFIDEFLRKHIPNDLPGAVFTLVKDGKVLFSKGYGYANLEQKIPIDPNKTLFRVGSISKVITATAIMQLVEQGKIGLDESITKYMEGLITNDKKFDPVTLHHLLTHTDGFDVGWTIDSATQCQSDLPSLEQFLSHRLLSRVFQPDQFAMYGDIGFTLVGRLIEVLTRMPFERYISQYLFDPLSMTKSSFQQPLPGNLVGDLAEGYRYDDNGRFSPVKFLCHKGIPSNSMSSTALNMAHFMIAHLQQGRYGNTQILQPETVEQIHRQHFSNFPEHLHTPGISYGFYEPYAKNHDQHILAHGGSMYGYTSQMLLMPDQNTGFFFAYNTNNLEKSLREELIGKFLSHYYPVKNTKALHIPATINATFERPSADFKRLATQMTGQYRHIRYPRHSLAKIGSITLSPKDGHWITTNSDGTITLFPGASQWQEIEPLIFQYPGSDEYLTFKQDGKGQILASSLSGFVFWVFEKIAWYEAGSFQVGLVIFLTIIFLSAIATWLLIELRYFLGHTSISSLPRLVVRLLGLTSALHLIFAGGILLSIQRTYYWEFVSGVPAIVVGLLYLPIVAVGLTTVLTCFTLWIGLTKNLPTYLKTQMLLVILAAWLTIPLLQYWNFLGFQFS
jgi:CubicO group peptidase (beta-lactamase class C family)